MYLLKIVWAIPFVILIFLIAFIFAIIPVWIMRLMGLRKASDRFAYFAATLVCDCFLFLFGCRVHIDGDIHALREMCNSGKKVCIIANHTSMLDIPVVYGAMCIKCGFITKSEYKYVPILNLCCTSLYCVFINRNNPKKGIQSIKEGAALIKQGHPMLIFPEGSRSKDGKIHEFMHGSFRLATLSGSAVVPVVIKGARRALENRKGPFSGSDCYVKIGEFTETAGLDRFQSAAMIESVESYIKREYDSMKGEV